MVITSESVVCLKIDNLDLYGVSKVFKGGQGTKAFSNQATSTRLMDYEKYWVACVDIWFFGD